MPLGTYSEGMRVRLGFSIVANLDFEILVLDEILAVGDILNHNRTICTHHNRFSLNRLLFHLNIDPSGEVNFNDNIVNYGESVTDIIGFETIIPRGNI